MRDGLVVAVLELYTEMGCLLHEAQRLLSPEAFRQMINDTGISGSVAKRSMRLANEFDGRTC
jgi:hypothetical protein